MCIAVPSILVHIQFRIAISLESYTWIAPKEDLKTQFFTVNLVQKSICRHGLCGDS
jgi:hypothetical protein